MDGFVLLLYEVQFHPTSYLATLESRFESPSIIHITGKDGLKFYTKPPMFDQKYLVLFDSLYILKSNKPYISFSYMFPVLRVETASQLDEAKFYCHEESLPFRVYNNVFEKDDATRMIQSQATEVVPDAVIKAIIKQVGLSPMRIITAVAVCEQMGYSVSVVEQYIDKWVYPELRKLIECLLGVPRSAAARKSVFVYLHRNRHWYRYIQQNLLDELSSVLEVYKGKITGEFSEETLFGYSDKHHITVSRIMFALKLFDKVSITSVFALREFVKSSSLMELVSQLI